MPAGSCADFREENDMIIFKLLQFILTSVSSPQRPYQCVWHTLTHKCTHFAEKLSWGQKSSQDTVVEIQGADDDWVTLVNSMERAVLWGLVPQHARDMNQWLSPPSGTWKEDQELCLLALQYCRSLCCAQWWAPPSLITLCRRGGQNQEYLQHSEGRHSTELCKPPSCARCKGLYAFGLDYLLSSCFTSLSWSPFYRANQIQDFQGGHLGTHRIMANCMWKSCDRQQDTTAPFTMQSDPQQRNHVPFSSKMFVNKVLTVGESYLNLYLGKPVIFPECYKPCYIPCGKCIFWAYKSRHLTPLQDLCATLEYKRPTDWEIWIPTYI